MKILFLDVDGVLNRDGTTERINGYIGVDRQLSDRLVHWLHQHPDVKIVLSSTWRHPLPGVPLIENLHDAGIEWIGETPRGHYRGEEIEEWLERNPQVTDYAIVDDMASTSFTDAQQPHLVQTDEADGLTDENLTTLGGILNI